MSIARRAIGAIWTAAQITMALTDRASPSAALEMMDSLILSVNFILSLKIKLTGVQKRSFWTSSERRERQLSALLEN